MRRSAAPAPAARWVALFDLRYVDAMIPAGTVGTEIAPDDLARDEARSLDRRRRTADPDGRTNAPRLVPVRFAGRCRFCEVGVEVRLHLAQRPGTLRRAPGMTERRDDE